jgi:hypothetical protein
MLTIIIINVTRKNAEENVGSILVQKKMLTTDFSSIPKNYR